MALAAQRSWVWSPGSHFGYRCLMSIVLINKYYWLKYDTKTYCFFFAILTWSTKMNFWMNTFPPYSDDVYHVAYLVQYMMCWRMCICICSLAQLFRSLCMTVSPQYGSQHRAVNETQRQSPRFIVLWSEINVIWDTMMLLFWTLEKVTAADSPCCWLDERPELALV